MFLYVFYTCINMCFFRSDQSRQGWNRLTTPDVRWIVRCYDYDKPVHDMLVEHPVRFWRFLSGCGRTLEDSGYIKLFSCVLNDAHKKILSMLLNMILLMWFRSLSRSQWSRVCSNTRMFISCQDSWQAVWRWLTDKGIKRKYC